MLLLSCAAIKGSFICFCGSNSEESAALAGILGRLLDRHDGSVNSATPRGAVAR